MGLSFYFSPLFHPVFTLTLNQLHLKIHLNLTHPNVFRSQKLKTLIKDLKIFLSKVFILTPQRIKPKQKKFLRIIFH